VRKLGVSDNAGEGVTIQIAVRASETGLRQIHGLLLAAGGHVKRISVIRAWDGHQRGILQTADFKSSRPLK
jgi:hypothetical protein